MARPSCPDAVETVVNEERDPWEQLPKEPSRAYDGFRAFRDLGPKRRVKHLYGTIEYTDPTIRQWSAKWNWFERAKAWDAHLYRLEDDQRLAKLADMQRQHALAGKLALAKAIAALQELSPKEIPGAVAVRLLELGTRLERSTLTTSLAELQGLDDEPGDAEDPWAVIARELTGAA